MKLLRCEILNYRSIKDLTIEFDNIIQTLVGFNEAGKSNIIKALSLLDPDAPISNDDLRDVRYTEDPPEKAYIRFVFSADRRATEKIYKSIKDEFYGNDLPEIKYLGKAYSLEEFCYLKNECLYRVDIKEKARRFQYWNLLGGEVSGNWKCVPDDWAYPDTFTNKSFKYINVDKHAKLADDSSLKSLTPSMINSKIGLLLIKVLEDELPSCIMWQYSPSNILPGTINIKSFIADSDTCIPLKNIFELCGYDDVEDAVVSAESKKNGMRNLLRRLSEKATEHLHQVWPEYKKIRISLVQNGEHIEAGIEDEYNIYSFDRRSDGFKRFITFLLLLSVGAKTNSIQDALILIDEPDICLHPTGIRFLRKELEKIASKNSVVISTHSIFMVDKDRVDRNLIVKKVDEETIVNSGDYSSILDEEVVYNALGFSLYEIIKPKNVIFEGWSDKYAFQKWLASEQSAAFSDDWKDIGLLYACGVKDIPRVAGVLDGFDRDYVIISDSDRPALEKQARFEGKGQWLTFKDLGFTEQETIEDFLDVGYVDKCIASVVKEEAPRVDELKMTENSSFNTKVKEVSKEIDADTKRLGLLIKNKLYERITGKQILLADLVSSIDITTRFDETQNLDEA